MKNNIKRKQNYELLKSVGYSSKLAQKYKDASEIMIDSLVKAKQLSIGDSVYYHDLIGEVIGFKTSEVIVKFTVEHGSLELPVNKDALIKMG